MVCLVQQLFRILVGSEVDPNVLHDTGFFDILYLESTRRDKIKRGPTMKVLVQDLNMTRRALSERSDAYAASSGIISTDQVGYNTGTWNKSMQTLGKGRRHGQRRQHVRIPPMSANKIKRITPHLSMSGLENLGLIDIVNMLRTLRHPHIYHKSVGHRNWYCRQLSSGTPYGFRAPVVDRPPTKTQQYHGNDLIIVLEEVDKVAIDKSIRDGMQLDEELFGEGREWQGQTIDEIREEIRLSDKKDISEFIERMIYKGQSFVWKVDQICSVEDVSSDTEDGIPWRGTLRESE